MAAQPVASLLLPVHCGEGEPKFARKKNITRRIKSFDEKT
jgi:hypothetical protein